MTYFEAESIRQDFMVHLQFADTCGKERMEAVKECSEKYTPEQMAEAYHVIAAKQKEERVLLKAILMLAIKSKPESDVKNAIAGRKNQKGKSEKAN